MSKVKICQSCAMPMGNTELYGTNGDGSLNDDYCKYCFVDGKFHSEETMEVMIESCISHCLDAGVYPDADIARADMLKTFPELKRWKSV